jgi:hypothetical protein
LHDVPSARCVHAVADVVGEHCSHGFVAFTAPSVTCSPSMLHITGVEASGVSTGLGVE